MNSKAIRMVQKKKLKTVTQEFNKKTGKYELQVKEGGRIIQREETALWAERFREEYKDDPLMPARLIPPPDED
jgi:hypothetical protein